MDDKNRLTEQQEVVLNTISKTLFLAKELDDFENFLLPNDNYFLICSRSSQAMREKYENIFIYEDITKFRDYSTSTFFMKNLFVENIFNMSELDFENIWTYQAYPWTDDLQFVNKNVFAINYSLFIKIKNKFFQHKMLDEFYKNHDNNPIQKKKRLLKTNIVSKNTHDYSFFKNIYDDKFVLTCSNSDGGSCVFLINNEHEYKKALKLVPSPVIKLDQFLPNSVPISQAGIVFSDYIVSYQPCIQIIQSTTCDNCFEYIGSDYNVKSFLTTKDIDELTETTTMIGKFLASLGYRGFFGCDYLFKNDEHLFIEINPRFQSSTFLLSMNAKLKENPYFLHIYSFLYDNSPFLKDVLLDTIPDSKESAFIKNYKGDFLSNRKPPSSIKLDDKVPNGFSVFKHHIVNNPFFPVTCNLSNP